MLARNVSRIFALGSALTAVCVSVYAQNTVYKWVDEDGVVHFGDQPPDSELIESETFTTANPPPVAPAQPATKSPAAKTNDATHSEQPETEIPLKYEKTNIADMSLADLDLRCEEAREKVIAPLRQAEIAECKQDKRNDPAWCERFNADYGEGGRTVSGSIRPRMFDDLTECVEAQNEWNRRGR